MFPTSQIYHNGILLYTVKMNKLNLEHVTGHCRTMKATIFTTHDNELPQLFKTAAQLRQWHPTSTQILNTNITHLSKQISHWQSEWTFFMSTSQSGHSSNTDQTSCLQTYNVHQLSNSERQQTG
jgi:hypothetical protein